MLITISNEKRRACIAQRAVKTRFYILPKIITKIKTGK